MATPNNVGLRSSSCERLWKSKTCCVEGERELKKAEGSGPSFEDQDQSESLPWEGPMGYGSESMVKITY